MKPLTPLAFDRHEAGRELSAFDRLLTRREPLLETKDILPLFRSSPNLALLIGNYFPNLRRPKAFALEYTLGGDFRADLVVGDPDAQQFLLVEFESATRDGLFRNTSRNLPTWSPRFERAFSQLVDWLWKLEDLRSTADFETCFGGRRAAFHGLIVIGKGMRLEPRERDRLRWRVENTVLASTKISCVSFEELRDDLDFFIQRS